MSSRSLLASDELGEAPGLKWIRAVGVGICWGIAVSALESLGLPLGHLNPGQLAGFVAGVAPHWIIAGVALATGTMWLEQRRWPTLAIALSACPLIAVVGQRLILADQQALSFGPAQATSLHVFWSALFYCGLFTFAYRLSVRSERTERMLRLAQIARQRADTLRTEAELDSLHGKIDPQFLLRVMVETKRRYDADPAGATRLVDDLVRFLRSAMPGVRSGASTVVAELQLADDYARVWAELEPARTTWVLHAGALPSEQPFPALLLLQALDQLAALAGGTHVAGVVDRVGSRTVLRLERSVTDATIGLADELLYRFRVGLRKFYGESWTLDVERTANRIALAITLPSALVRDPLPNRAGTFAPFTTGDHHA